MNILFLAHTFPYPLNDGVRLHSYYLLKEFCKKNTVFLLCLNDTEVSGDHKKTVENLGVKIVEVLTHRVPQNFFLRLLNTVFDPVPFFVRQFESSPLRKCLRSFLGSRIIDVVHVDYLSMAVYMDEFPALPKVFFPHDAVSMLFERNIRSEKNLFRKFYTYMQWKKIRNFESEWIPKFNSSMVVSPVDKEHLQRHCPGANIAVSPNGVDTDYFYPQEGTEEENSVMFRGVMNFQPNTDAARFFYEDILPLVRKEIPAVKFYVVGKYPSKDLLDAAKKDKNLIITDYVDDLRVWTAKAAVIVCPMRIGSGIKNKILESMSMAKAIVATPMAAAGIEVKNGEHLFLEEKPEAFAEKVIRLLKDPAARAQTGGKAREFVVKHHAWSKNAGDFEELYRQAIAFEEKQKLQKDNHIAGARRDAPLHKG